MHPSRCSTDERKSCNCTLVRDRFGELQTGICIGRYLVESYSTLLPQYNSIARYPLLLWTVTCILGRLATVMRRVSLLQTHLNDPHLNAISLEQERGGGKISGFLDAPRHPLYGNAQMAAALLSQALLVMLAKSRT